MDQPPGRPAARTPSVTPVVTLGALVASLGAQVLHAGSGLDRAVRAVFAGDRMSDLIGHAGEEALIVTNLEGAQLVRAAQLLDASAVLLVGAAMVRPETLAEAQQQGTALLVSPFGLYETCGRLYQIFTTCREQTTATGGCP